MKRLGWVVAIVGWLGLLSEPVGAQSQADLLQLFFDCQAPGCRDLDFFRRAVPFVSWVRDREVSDLHVLVRSQQAGGGGNQYTMTFIGRRAFDGDQQELLLGTAGDATTDEQRNVIVERLKLGLVRYVQATPVAERLTVTFDSTGGGPGVPDPDADPADDTQGTVNDPWDFWVFRINGNGFLNGQATSKRSNYFGSISADRTTEELKLNLGGNFSRNIQEFEISDGDGGFETIRETRQDWGLNSAIVKSLGSQWAAGVQAEVGSSTFFNQAFRLSLKPGLEYNFFPYDQSSQRSLTLQYLVGPNYFEYEEETIFQRTEETRFQESLTGRLSLIQPWGRWSTSVTAAHYLHDAGKYNVTVEGNFNVRLFRGFSIRASGNYSWIRDQLFVSASGATDAQILLQQRQLATNFRYFTSFGIEYRFGSIFNNVVNPRFGGGGSGVFFF